MRSTCRLPPIIQRAHNRIVAVYYIFDVVEREVRKVDFNFDTTGGGERFTNTALTANPRKDFNAVCIQRTHKQHERKLGII